MPTDSKNIADLEQKANQGDSNAQYNLGYCYLYGKGCKKDKSLAQAYFRKAAMQNHPDAQVELACLLRSKRDTEFWHWFCCAYLNGNIPATQCLNMHLARAKNNGNSMKAKLDQLCQHIQQNGITSIPNKKFLNSIDPTANEGCYIATAVYGSYDAPEVKTLRQYRDQQLLQNTFGRILVKIYYFVSPALAQKLKKMPKVNRLVKSILDRVVDKIKLHGYSNE